MYNIQRTVWSTAAKNAAFRQFLEHQTQQQRYSSTVIVLINQQQLGNHHYQQKRFKSSTTYTGTSALPNKFGSVIVSGSDGNRLTKSTSAGQSTGSQDLSFRLSKSADIGSSLPQYLVFSTANTYGRRQSSTVAWDITHEDVDRQSITASSSSSTAVEQVSTRPLVILFGWMLCKSHQLEKFRKYWTSRGCDILTVQTSPISLLFPSIGGRRVSENAYNFISSLQPRYDEIIIHAFSVGGYQYGELLECLFNGIKAGDPKAQKFLDSIKGTLIDSVVFAEDCPTGLSRAITLHPIVQPIVEKSIRNFLFLTHPFTFARYKKVEGHIINNFKKIPSMLLYSKDDVASNWRSNAEVIEKWKRNNIPTQEVMWEKSGHVLHYRFHKEEYQQAIESFVTKQMKVSKISLESSN